MSKPEGLSDRAEMWMIAIPTLILGALLILITCAGCGRSPAPVLPEPAPAEWREKVVAVPAVTPERALEASVANMILRINRGLSENDMTYYMEKPVACQLVKVYAAKGWQIEVHEHTDSSAYLRFSWPEVK